MNIPPLSNRLSKYLQTRNLVKRFEKQKLIFEANPFHPGLRTEILEPQEEGGYTATVPALPGCISEGDTAEESLENIKDATEGYLKTLVKHQRKDQVKGS